MVNLSVDRIKQLYLASCWTGKQPITVTLPSEHAQGQTEHLKRYPLGTMRNGRPVNSVFSSCEMETDI